MPISTNLVNSLVKSMNRGAQTPTAAACLRATSRTGLRGFHVIAPCASPKSLGHKQQPQPVPEIHMRQPGTNYVGVKYPQPIPELVEENRNNVMNLFSLKGKVASITGSSGGIGFEVAKAYAQAGADIAIWYNSRNPEDKVKYLQENYGVKVKAYQAPVDNFEAVEKTVAEQIKDFGKIDIMVANAGIIWGGDSIIDEPDNSHWADVMRVNVDGVYYCSKVIGRHFRERGKGSLVMTASMSGTIVNVPDTMTAYCTSKAAVAHLAKCLALEWAGFARVNCVSPGYVRGDMTKAKEAEGMENWGPISPMGRMCDPRELVGAYLYLASDASSFTTGADIMVDGGYSLM